MTRQNKADGRLVYNELLEVELVSYLKQNTSSFNLIVSSDTLVYFGEQKGFFLAVKMLCYPCPRDF